MSITPIGHYINGQVAAGASGRSQAVTNPATGAVTGQVALANSAEVAQAVAAAQAAFPAWADTPPLRRARVLPAVPRQHDERRPLRRLTADESARGLPPPRITRAPGRQLVEVRLEQHPAALEGAQLVHAGPHRRLAVEGRPHDQRAGGIVGEAQEQEAVIDRLVVSNSGTAGTPAGDRMAAWSRLVINWQDRRRLSD